MAGGTGRADDEAIVALALKAGLLAPEDLAAARAVAPSTQVDWLIANQRLSDLEVSQMTALLDATMRRRMQATLPPLTGVADLIPPTLHGERRPDSGVIQVPERIGAYAVASVLGQGAMGTVYRARRDGAEGDVALKVLRADILSPAVVARFRREAEAARALADHPAIVGVSDIGVADGRTYFAMDLIEGATLDRLIQGGELSATRAARIVATVARGVHYAHTEGILHRDLKPGNIIVDATDQPHVVDFGLATRQAADEAAARLTRTGELIGTPAYMAPEQVGNTAVDVRADIYGLGATLFDALCGQPPFVGATSYDILRQVTVAEPPLARSRNPVVPVALETIVAKCLRKESAQRYETAEALAEDLERFLRQEPVRARRESRIARTARRVRRNPAPWLAAGLAVGVLLAAALAIAIAAVRARIALRHELDLARAVAAGDPDRALGLLQSIEARAPDLDGLAEVRAAALARRDALALETRRAQATTLLASGRAAAERHAALHAEWLRLEAEDDAALTRELAGAPADHDPGQAARRTRLAELSPERDAAYAAALSALAGAEQVLAAHADAPERVAAAELAAGCAWSRLQAAEARFDRDAAARFARDLAVHGAATHAAEVRGAGTLTLHTAPAGARVRAGRYVEREGILVAEPDRELGVTPLDAVPLPMGSWLLWIEREGFAPVRYPVQVLRGEAHLLRAPLRLLTAAQIGAGFVYVPGGFTVLGNDGKARTSWPPHRRFVDGFLIGRDEVTVGEYAAFADDLLARGAPVDDVQARLPRQNARSDYLWMVRDGRTVRHAVMGNPDTPVSGVSWDDAMAYVAWRSERDRRRYRLPSSDEWQRAGRGADGRRYPWGTVFDWRRCVGGRWPGHGEHSWSAPAGSALDDESPFGVRDLCGNLEEWIGGDWSGGRGRRGGCFALGGLIDFHLANHGTAGPGDTNLSRGFRLAADVPGE